MRPVLPGSGYRPNGHNGPLFAYRGSYDRRTTDIAGGARSDPEIVRQLRAVPPGGKAFLMNVLMIGLDGATFTLLDPMMQNGVMPHLRSVVARGVRADLMSTRNPLTPPAWTSMITGRSPEAHGIYDFLRPAFMKDGGVFLKINDFRDNHCETVWSMVNRAGLRATSLNFYGMAPP